MVVVVVVVAGVVVVVAGVVVVVVGAVVVVLGVVVVVAGVVVVIVDLLVVVVGRVVVVVVVGGDRVMHFASTTKYLYTPRQGSPNRPFNARSEQDGLLSHAARTFDNDEDALQFLT